MPVFDDEGSFRGYRGSDLNVTAEYEAKDSADASQIRFMEAIEHAPQGIVYWDSDNRFVMCNSKFREDYAHLVDLLVPGTPNREFLTRAADHADFAKMANSKAEWLDKVLSVSTPE